MTTNTVKTFKSKGFHPMTENETTKANGMISLKGSGVPEVRAYPIGHVYKIYIYGPLEETSDFVDSITILDTASENDIIHIHLATPGGNVDAAIALIHAIQRCQANVIANADGNVASAGVPILFACDGYVIAPYAHFMVHDGSYGSMQKVNEQLKNALATSNLLSRLYYDLLTPVFSEEEIEDVLEGKDIYVDSDEMLERIEAAQTKLQEEAEAECDENVPEMLVEEKEDDSNHED